MIRFFNDLRGNLRKRARRKFVDARPVSWGRIVPLLLAPFALLAFGSILRLQWTPAVWGELWLFPMLLAGWFLSVPGAVAVAIVALVAMAVSTLGVGLPHHATGLSDLLWQFAVLGGLSAGVGLLPPSHRSLLTAGVGSGRGNEPATTSPDGYERVLASLAKTVEIRDQHTQGHCKRVARNAVVMGRALGMSSSDLALLHWAATLHDLGKIAVPEYILLKSGRLTEDEFAEIRRHPAYGADLLASVSPSFRPIAEVVRAHHERWDGLGYPLGNKGPEIPEMARIIAIVDVFEALTSERPYRSPMSDFQALQYVKNAAGTQFDPALVGLFEVLYRQGEVECASPTTQRVSPELPVFKSAALHTS